jgi:transcriptional regulator
MTTIVPISPEIWKLANQVLTPKQLTVFELREKHGLSWHQIAIYTNRTRANARNHYEAAVKNIYDALEEKP